MLFLFTIQHLTVVSTTQLEKENVMNRAGLSVPSGPPPEVTAGWDLGCTAPQWVPVDIVSSHGKEPVHPSHAAEGAAPAVGFSAPH